MDTTPPHNENAELLLSGSSSAAYCRTAATHARALLAVTTTPRIKQYLGKMIARYEGRVVGIEGPARV
jgi:hypothetical protein